MSADTVPARSSGGPDLRGSSADRRARKRWLLDAFGDGHAAPCALCDRRLTYRTVTVDRIVPGSEGGRYTRDNIQPACRSCNCSRGAVDIDAYRRAGFVSPV